MGEFVKIDETVNSRGTLIPLEDYNNSKKLSSILNKSPNSDWYASLYVLGPEIEEYFNKSNSIKGYDGSAYSSKLIFDFDCKSDLEKARKDAQELITRLKNLGVNLNTCCRIYFSGNKGFHLTIETVHKYSPEELKIICSNICEGLETFDNVIYNKDRKFRIPNTKHQESKLYKIELKANEFKTLSENEIKEKAKNKVEEIVKTIVPTEFDFRKEFYKEAQKPKLHIVTEEELQEIDGIRGLNQIDFSHCPKERPKCIHALLQGVMVPGRGERNQIYLHLGNYLRNQGHNKRAVYGYLKGIMEENARLYPEDKPYTKERIWNEIISRVFSGDKHNTNGWGVDPKDTVFARYCKSLPYDKPCPMHDGVQKEIELVKIDDVFASFNSFATTFEQNIVPTGIKFIDDYMKICVGTTTLIAGAAGCGKTTLVLNIIENSNKLKMESVFFSLDMVSQLVYLKLAQKLTNLSQDKILDAFKYKDVKQVKYIKDVIKENYKYTHFDFSGALSMDDMKQRVLAVEQKTGNKVKLAAIDYVGRVTSNFNDSYANAKYNALRSKDVAMDTMAAWLMLTQIGRQTGDGSNPLRSKRVAKDSGDYEEAASNVITLWRPFLSMDGQKLEIKEEGSSREILLVDDVIRVFMAKNRLGRELEEILVWDGAKGIIRDMTDEEKFYYKSEREDLEKYVQKTKKGF